VKSVPRVSGRPAMAATQDSTAPVVIVPVRTRVARLLDTFARGASPPGLIDMAPPPRSSPVGASPVPTNSHLRRRFTMIATFDTQSRSTRRRTAPAWIVSLALAAVALTGAVRGQETRQTPKPGAPDVKSAQPKKPISREQAEKLWKDKYADQVIFVNGREANRQQVDRQYLEELAALGGVEDSSTASAKGRAPADGAESKEDRETSALLDRRIPELNFDGVALADVVDFLRDVSGANVFVEWGALEGAGIDRNAPVTVRVRNVSFSNALEMVLSSAGKGSVPIAYGIKDGVIRISTGEQLDRLVDTRAYDVRDLVPAEIEMKDLASMIRASVEPDSWRDSGGSVGALHTSKHKMIVTATDPSHRKIRTILQMLRDEPRQARAEDAASAAQAPAPTPAGPRQ
jgi:hypothetical protein